MDLKDSNRTAGRVFSRDWRWLTGGSVIGLAVVIGCASALDFHAAGRATNNDLRHSKHVSKERPFTRKLAAEAGNEPMHNEGKLRMPLSVTVEGDMRIVISRDTNLIFSITAESDVNRLQGHIQGGEGLEGFASVPINIPQLAAGETHMLELNVPAKTGSLYFRLVGDYADRTMSGAFEIKIVNPKEVKAAAAKSGPTDMQDAPSADASGLLVQPMKSSPR